MPHIRMRRCFVALAVALAAGCGAEDVQRVTATDWHVETPTHLVPVTMPDGGIDLVARPLGAFDEPVDVAWRANVGWYVAERAGRVLRVVDGRAVEVLDLREEVRTSGEQGLFGIAFSPDGDRLYVTYAGPDADFYLDELRMDAIGRAVDRRSVLRIAQRYAYHYGGSVGFGPDGLLYVGVGDGGNPPDDAPGHAQDLGSLHGKILRIDPGRQFDGRPYGIPSDNPFVATPGAHPEVFAYGLRNPWRFSFDTVTGDLWIGDVGDEQVEEIDRLVAGGRQVGGRGANLGWNIVEGDLARTDLHPEGQPAATALHAPFHTYRHDDTCSVTGGLRYWGDAIEVLHGRYVFGDLCAAQLWALDAAPRADRAEATAFDVRVDGVQGVVSIDAGPDGELVVVSLSGVVAELALADAE